MKTVLYVVILGLLMALTMSAQCGAGTDTCSPGQIPTLSCSDVCNALGLTGWLWLNCFAVCQGYAILTDNLQTLPPSLKENPFFLRPCEQKQIIPKPDLHMAANWALRRLAV